MHISTNLRSLAVYQYIVNKFDEIVRRYSLNDIEYLDAGGGFYGEVPHKPQWEDYISTISEELFKRGYNPDRLKLIIEPGVSLLSGCFSYYTQVEDVKDTPRSHFVVLDGSRNHIDPLMHKTIKSYFYSIEQQEPTSIFYCPQILVGYTCLEYDSFFELVKGRKQKKERQQLHFEEQQTGMTEDKNLFENLRQLRLKIATERGVPPYVIFSDKTLHQLAIVQPITYIAFGSISGVGTHKLESLGTIFVKAIREYKGLSTNESEEWNDRIIKKDIEIKEPVTTPKAKKSVRDVVTFNGTEYHIGSELMGCIKWRTTIENVGKDVYYNLWQV